MIYLCGKNVRYENDCYSTNYAGEYKMLPLQMHCWHGSAIENSYIHCIYNTVRANEKKRASETGVLNH